MLFRSISYSKRSAGNPVSKSDAYFLGDSVGEMAAYFRAADLAFIGGTLLDYGGQNLIEACAAGTPVLLGPSTFNFAWAAEEAISVGAARRVKNASELVDLVTELLEDEQIREAMGAAGRKFCALHTGAADRIAKIAMDLLENGADARG